MSHKRKINFFSYPYVYISGRERWHSIFEDVGSRGAVIMQKDLAEFENNLAAYTGARFAVGVANATDGLQMALMAGGISEGDEVIFCTHTMVATAAAIHFAGGIPVPVDAGSDHLIDPNAIEAAITPKTKVILPTQLNGRTVDMDKIQAIASSYNLMIFEDAAQALGSKFNGKSAGTFGIASCISFYPAKNLGCFGDGGAVVTNDEEIYRQLLLLRDHGRDQSGDIVLWGFNSRLDNFQAAILKQRLREYDQIVNRRREVAFIYHKHLGSINGLVLPPAPGYESDHFDVFQNYEIEAEHRDELKSYLTDHGIGTLIQWGGKLVHEFKRLGFTQSLPFTENLMKRMLMLPMNMSLSDDDIYYICCCIRDFYAGM